MTTTHTQGNITNLRGDINREAALRVWDVGGALRVHLNNMTLSGLREYIALSRHQFELTEFVCERTGQSGQSGGGDDGPEVIPVMNYVLGRHELVPFRRRNIETLPPTPGWELEMLDDMAWRARAIGAVLKRLGPQIPVRSADDHAELSRHQCEIVDFMTTGSFRKVPKRRKSRTLSGGAVTPESAQRIKELGEALQEYQGRMEIKTVREFIALSKHQCELAGLLFASVSGEGKEPVFNVVHYTDEYKCAVGSSSYSGPVGKRPRERGKHEDERFVMSEPEGRVENRPSAARTSGESASPGVPFCDTFGHAKVSEEILDTPVKPEYDENKCRASSPSGPISYMDETPDSACCGTGSSGNGPYSKNHTADSPAKEAVFLGHIIEQYSDGSARVHVDIPGYPNEVDLPEDCLPPDSGPVRFYLTPQGPMVYRRGYDYDDDEWDDDAFP